MMSEGEKKNSAIKNGLIALSKLKGSAKYVVGSSSNNEKKKSTKKHTVHPDDDDIQAQQYNNNNNNNERNNAVDLTNADFQIKFLLNGFFENIGDEDKPSNAVDDKLKKLFDQTINDDDNKAWKKSSTKYNNRSNNKGAGNFSAKTQAANKQKRKRFQSSKLLSKMSFEHSNQKNVDNNVTTTTDNVVVNERKISSSSRNLPNCHKIPIPNNNNKKRSRFGMESTHNLHSMISDFSRKSDTLYKKTTSSKNNTNTVSDGVSGGTLNFTFKKESKTSNNILTTNSNVNNNNHTNTLSNYASSYFDTEHSNKTTYHHEQTMHTFNSSKKIKTTAFTQFNVDSPAKRKFKTTKFKKKHSDDSFKGYFNQQQHEHTSNVLELPLPAIHKSKTNKHNRINYQHHPSLLQVHHHCYPLKAKTLEHPKRTKQRINVLSSLSCCYSKFLEEQPSKDIRDIMGISRQTQNELQFIQSELQNHVFMHDDTTLKDVDGDVALSSPQHNASTLNDNKTLNDDTHNNSTTHHIKSFMNSSMNEDTNQHLTHNESNNTTHHHHRASIISSHKKVDIDDKHRKLQQKGYVYDSLDDEECEDEIEINFYIQPDSLIVRVLDFILFWCILYSVFEIPYRLAHDLDLDCIRNGTYINYFVISECFIHTCLILDIILSFFKAYRSFDDRIITKSRLIALKYLKSWFIPDVIAAIPFYMFLRINSPHCINVIPKYYNAGTKPVKYMLILLRLCKLCKIYLNNTWYTSMRTYLLQTEHFYLWFNMYNGIVIFFMYVHSMACLFIFFAQTSYQSWILNLGYDTSSFSKLYITAFYYVITTVTSTGYGDIPVANRFEYGYNLFLLLIGVQACSYALSSFVDIINANDDKSVEYVRSCKVLEEMRLTHRMPMKLYDKVARLLKYRMMYEKKDKNIIIDSLPLKIRNTLIYEMYKPVIQNFVFFKSFDNKDFIVRVLLAFKPILASKYDILVKEGDYIVEVIFVKSGILSLEISIRTKDNNNGNNNNNNNNGTTTATLFTGATPTTTDNHRTKTSYSNLNMLPSRKTSMFMMYTRTNGGSLGLPKTNSNFQMKVNTRMAFNQLTSNYDSDNDNDDNDDESYTVDPSKSHIKGKKSKKHSETGIEYIKILEIRKNEHFGDILMFLDRRSPLTVRVKSKKTELFYLEKTDAVEIASTFPVVWRKIIKKSLFNMEQMERLINKAVKVCHKIYNTNVQNDDGENHRKYSLSSKNTNTVGDGRRNKMLSLIKETGVPVENESDELRSIPSSLQESSSSSSSSKRSGSASGVTQQYQNQSNPTNKDDSMFEEEEYPTTNATRMKLLAQGGGGGGQSVIIEESEYGCGSEKSKNNNNNNTCNGSGSNNKLIQLNTNTNVNVNANMKNDNKESEGCLIDEDENSTKYKISLKDATNRNTNNSTCTNNINTNRKNSFVPKKQALTETQITIKVNLDSKNIGGDNNSNSNDEFQPIIDIDSSSYSPTPFKFSDINTEFYPCELNNNNTNNEHMPSLLMKQDVNKVNELIGVDGMLSSLWKTPSSMYNENNMINDMQLFEQHNNNNNVTSNRKYNEVNSNKQRHRASSFDNISICSTTTSLSVSHSYENLNEITGFTYISSPQLQSKVKTMLQLETVNNDIKDHNNNNNNVITPNNTNKDDIHIHIHTHTNNNNNNANRSSSNLHLNLSPNFHLNPNTNNNNTTTTTINPRGSVIKVGSVGGSIALKTVSPRKRFMKSCSVNITEENYPINNHESSSNPQLPFVAINGGGNSKMMQPISKKKSSMIKLGGLNKDLLGAIQPIAMSGHISSRARGSALLKINKQKKPDLLNVISHNIETNNQILNQPGLFCADYFQKVMVDHNQKKEQHNLYKRLLNTEKILNDIGDKGSSNVDKKSGHFSPIGSRGNYSIQPFNKMDLETG